MVIEDSIKELIKSKFGNVKAFAEEIDLPYTTVRSILQRGILNATMENVIKIADGLGLKAEDLIEDKYLKETEPYGFNGLTAYDFLDVGIAAGSIETIEQIIKEGDELEQIEVPDEIMGKYVSDKSIFFTRVNGESLNRVIPNRSLIAVKQVKDREDFKDGDIVMFSYGNGYSCKRFFNDKEKEKLVFSPESTSKGFYDIVVPYENALDLQIVGKIVLYIVNLD